MFVAKQLFHVQTMSHKATVEETTLPDRKRN